MREIRNFYVTLTIFIIGSILLIVPALGYNLQEPLDASSINGIIAAIAMLFGFVSLEAREIKHWNARFTLIMTLIIFLMITSEIYFLAVMSFGHPIKLVLLIAMTNLFFNILSSSLVMWARPRL